MGTNTGTIMTLANSIIGVSVLAMPFCFKQCGIVLSIVMLLSSSYVSRLACHFLLKAAIMARRRNFEFLAFHTFGSTGKFAAELFIIGFLMGTCIAFFVVVGDLGPAIIAKAIGVSNTAALRPSVLIGLAVFVVLPLGLLRNVDSLASVCTATIGFYLCLVLKVVAEAMPHLLAGDWLDKVHLWRPAGFMQCIPIFSMALFCQTQLFEIYESMHNASLDCMNDVIRAAVNMCTGVYICVGFFGYIAYYSETFTGNVMMSFTPSMMSEIIKMGFVLSVAVSFPLVIFPCRASLYSLLFRRIGVPHHEGVSSHIPEARFKCLTVFIISVALVVGLLIPNIELVLGLVGSTIGVLICVMFPAAAYICISPKSSRERLLAQAVLFIGALILVLGTYATLYAANEVSPEVKVTSLQSDVVVAGDIPQLPNKIVGDALPLNLAIDQQKAEPNVKMKDEIVESKEKLPVLQLVKEDEVHAKTQVEESVKVKEDKVDVRQEPPVPVEPARKVVQSAAPAVKEVKEKVAIPIEEQPAEAVVPELEKKEAPAEQVNQDAIKKEDEELAEAEKQAKDDSKKKDAELLRKLEEHEEEQIKLLQEQKQILQALQEHKKEIEREKVENAGKQLNRTGKVEVAEPVKLSEEKVSQKKEDKKEVGSPAVQNVVNNEVVKLIQQDPVDNTALRRTIIPAVPVGSLVYQESLAKKTVKIPPPPHGPPRVSETILPKKNPEAVAAPVPPIAPNPQAPVVSNVPKKVVPAAVPQPSNLLLERLKSAPLPLTLQNKPAAAPPLPVKLAEAVVQNMDEDAKAMRREILQEPAGNVVSKNAPQENIMHEREKRDAEEGIRKLQQPEEISKDETVQLNEENCAKTEKVTNTDVKELRNEIDPIIKKESVITNLIGDVKLPESKASSATLEVNNNDVRNKNLTITIHNLLQPIPEGIQIDSENVRSPQNISNVLNAVNVDSAVTVQRENENTGSLIKTASHLTQPRVQSDSLANIDDLRPGLLQQEAKPMKRDLKSVPAHQEEEKSNNE